MSNTLTKSVGVTTLPGSPAVAAVPASPGTPAYTSYTQVQTCGFVTPGVTYGWVTPTATPDNPNPQPQYVPVNSSGVPAPAIYQCTPTLQPTYHPGTPPTPGVPGSPGSPSQTALDYNLGWNSGARSVAQADGDLFAQFTPQTAVGIVAGLNNLDLGWGYAEILYGLYFGGGVVQVYESGSMVYAAGAYARGDVFRIQRVAGQVSYLKNGTAFYTSALPSSGIVFLDTSFYSGGDSLDSPSIGNLNTSAGSLQPLASYATAVMPPPVQTSPATTATTGGTLAAGTYYIVITALNADGETIKSNEVSITTTGTTSTITTNWGAVPGATGYRVYYGTATGAENTYFQVGAVTTYTITGAAGTAGSPPATNTTGNITSSSASLPHLVLTSSFFQGGASSLLPLAGFGGSGSLAQAIGTVPHLVGQGSAGFAQPSFALSSTVLPALQLSASSTTGGLIESNNASLVALSGLGGAYAAGASAFGQSSTTTPALRTFAYAYEGNFQASMGERSFGADLLAAGAEIAVVISDGGFVQGVLTFGVMLDAVVADGGTFADSYTAAADVAALMRSLVFTDAGMPTVAAPGAANQDNKVWVVDWEGEAHASTAYESYPFNSFAVIDGAYFGAKDDGVYLLDGVDDAGTPIHASVHFGRLDFKTSNRKHVPNVYAGVGASGQLYLRVSVDGGQPYLYTARRIDAAQRVTRFDLGKGLVGSYFAFELYNQNGADFDLDTVEFVAVPVTRRV